MENVRKSMECDGRITNFKNMYNKVTGNVQINGKRSSTFEIGRSISGGTTSSPVLFILSNGKHNKKSHKVYRESADNYSI